MLRVGLRLGLTSFGGPIAHIGYFRREFVEQRRWLTDELFGDLVAICQSLPGPASSQLAIAIGTMRAGLRGGLTLWLGFTLPSALALMACAVSGGIGDSAATSWAHGLRLAAVAVVAQAVWLMRISLAPDPARRLVAVVALGVVLLLPSPWTPLALIAGGGVVGALLIGGARSLPGRLGVSSAIPVVTVGRRTGFAALALFAGLLLVLPVLRVATGWPDIVLADTFYRAGALVFGGGHVVLPLLHDAVVAPGWVRDDVFLAGYGAAQAVPGPLFTFAGYLGAVVTVGPGGIVGGLMALIAIFLPGALLVWGALPFWEEIRTSIPLQGAISGIGAAVVGLLAAALYDPVWRGSVSTPADAIVAIGGFVVLTALRLPPLIVVASSVVVALALGLH
jgi:chromate transporter